MTDPRCPLDSAVPAQPRRDGVCLREGVSRRHGSPRNRAQTTPRTPPTNPLSHHAQRWVEKCDRSIKGSDTPHFLLLIWGLPVFEAWRREACHTQIETNCYAVRPTLLVAISDPDQTLAWSPPTPLAC